MLSIAVEIHFFLSQVIQSNQERFVEMLNEGTGGESGGGGGGGGGGNQPAGGAGGGTEGRYVQVTPDEKQAIERVWFQHHN